MKIFPTSHYTFKLYGDEKESIERLKRRTEPSESFGSQRTEKSFLGKIDGNSFKIISSEIGRGAFCVMSGKIENNVSFVNVEINKPFRVLLSIILCLPILGLGLSLLLGNIEDVLIIPFVAIFQIIIIRFIAIELAFKFLSKKSLNRLSDVLDIDWIKKV
jgi:hypothetical protein